MCPPSSSNSRSSPLNPTFFVPASEIGQKAFELASSHLHPAILNHSIRVYLYAKAVAASKRSTYNTDQAKQDLLFAACILHDIGTTERHNGPNRFEVDGADAAVEHLAKFGMSEDDSKEVWVAIALHTSDGIVQRMGELARIVRMAIEIDFGRNQVDEFEGLAGMKERFEGKYKRMEIEEVLGDEVVEQAVKSPGKAPPNSWPGVLYRSHLENPNWPGVNKAF
ncbi:hypothetical protein K458DRAFT_289916 [Lentithecium fluviatile CBS 122367]|uniref:HD/PDEase domain-containing protein n=1 Tax=Lentithecium fluviatile CBS 122367 TaxID=1168545 RepID=A0A6G1JJV8_9PLEO|nr:hypothetical protein K458DRAFT_289916 [Lentithecium fluviatile CBS 122367]